MNIRCVRTTSVSANTTSDQLLFNGCKVYAGLWVVGGGNSGIAVSCLCFPLYTRSHQARKRRLLSSDDVTSALGDGDAPSIVAIAAALAARVR